MTIYLDNVATSFPSPSRSQEMEKVMRYCAIRADQDIEWRWNQEG